MATWRQEFERLSAVERENIGKWKGGANNIPALRQSMEAVSEFLRQYEQAGLPGFTGQGSGNAKLRMASM